MPLRPPTRACLPCLADCLAGLLAYLFAEQGEDVQGLLQGLEKERLREANGLLWKKVFF